MLWRKRTWLTIVFVTRERDVQLGNGVLGSDPEK